MPKHDFRHGENGGRVEATIGDDGFRVVTLIQPGGSATSYTSSEPRPDDFPAEGTLDELLAWGVARLV